MTRTFLYAFDPSSANPIPGATVALTVDEIENAGLKEVLQTPGPAFGSWVLLDVLLQPTGAGTPFLFREPLGQSREVKVALSGLFGRFIARAYLERYFGLAVFANLGKAPIVLDGRRQVRIVRTARGDLPDWMACAANLSQLTVAEAKGCHDAAGPDASLGRAWTQVNRVNVTARGRRVTVKRIAVATRWGSAVGGATDTRLSVRDPEDEGDPIPPEDMDAVYLGLLRRHIASLIAPLGHQALASSLLNLAATSTLRTRSDALQRVQTDLDAASTSARVPPSAGARDVLIGGVITRAGPMPRAEISAIEQRALSRLALRPTFVGIERNIIKAAISEDVSFVRSALSARQSGGQSRRSDAVGTWVVPLGEEADPTSGS